ncbi:hypothetical protein BH11PSE11_BH11PSE11_02620 [soil metagenome]
MIERSLSFGPDNGLIGTLCLPGTAEHASTTATAGIILFNAGIVHRVGPHRLNVRLARILADSGIPSIRFDLAGVGDSHRGAGDIGFEAQAVSDLQAAMTALGEASGLNRFGLFGFCSGAFHSYNAAHVDERIAGILLFDAYRYGTLKTRLIRLSLRFRQHGVFSTIVRLGLKSLKQLPKKLHLRKSPEAAARASEVGLIVDTSTKAEFAKGVQSLLQRGIDVQMIYAGDGFEAYNYALQFHDTFKRYGITDKVKAVFLPEIDHVATSSKAQTELIDHILRWSLRLAGLPTQAGSGSSSDDGHDGGSGSVQYGASSSTEVQGRPGVIVLSRSVTGLETVRCLGKAGIRVHAIYFNKNDTVKFSRHCIASFFDDSGRNETSLINFLIECGRKESTRPIIVPTCDAHALMLANNRDLLAPYCQVMTDAYSSLKQVIHKHNLQAQAELAGLSIIPSIVAPCIEEIKSWSLLHKAPYLVKPFFAGIQTSRLRQKNMVLPTREALLAYVCEGDMQSLLVQRVIPGGDGYIFDCYGYCNAKGEVVAMASKRRLRQNLPDFGTCTYGEIPAYLDAGTQPTIFSNTRQFFEQISYHGIFGVEWLYDREDHKFYLIDFNARPFMSIGHVAAAGLNLPALAYADMVGDDISRVQQTPRLKHLIGIDLMRDIESFQSKFKRGELSFRKWLQSLLKVRHFYYWDWRDPLPGVVRGMEISRRAAIFLWHAVIGLL